MSLKKILQNYLSDNEGSEARYQAKLTEAQKQKEHILQLLEQEYEGKIRPESHQNSTETELNEASEAEIFDKDIEENEATLLLFSRVKKAVLRAGKRGWRRIVRNLKKLFHNGEKSIGEEVFARFNHFKLQNYKTTTSQQNFLPRLLTYLKMPRIRGQADFIRKTPSLIRQLLDILRLGGKNNTGLTLQEGINKNKNYLNPESLKVEGKAIKAEFIKNISVEAKKAQATITYKQNTKLDPVLLPSNSLNPLATIPSILATIISIIIPLSQKLWKAISSEPIKNPTKIHKNEINPNFCPIPHNFSPTYNNSNTRILVCESRIQTVVQITQVNITQINNEVRETRGR